MPRYATTLDIRTLAEEWRDLELDVEIAVERAVECEPPHPVAPRLHRAVIAWNTEREFDDERQKFIGLCREIGVDEDPDSLERWGSDYEPTLIAEDDFEDYARELAQDIGAVSTDQSWPNYAIDWERAANDLEADYTHIAYDGKDYLMRQA